MMIVMKALSFFPGIQTSQVLDFLRNNLRKIEKINICMKLAKIAFKLLMKIWDSCLYILTARIEKKDRRNSAKIIVTLFG